MGFRGSSRSPCQFTSVSLRTNEEFLRVYDQVTEARGYAFESRWFHDGFLQALVDYTDPTWESFQDKLWDVDRRVRKAEMNALFSEVVAGIMLDFEHNILPVLWNFCVFYEEVWERITDPVQVGSHLSDQNDLLKALLEDFAECVSSGLESAHKLVSSLVFLSFVYQYLIGCVDKDGSKTYSPGSLLFRLIFVAIVLFLGSYVWIKFRQASYTASRRKRKSCLLADRALQSGHESDVPEGVYRRAVKDATSSVAHYKYEPRFKPRREKLESCGTSLKLNYLPLGSCDTPREAEIVHHIAAVLYGKEEGRPVQFEDGPCLPFPSVTEPEKCPPFGKEKAVWVTHKTKELYAQLLREKERRLQPLHPALEVVSHPVHAGEARRSDPFPSAPGALELTCFTSPHGGNGVVEERAISESHGSGQEAPLARKGFSAFFSDSDFEQCSSSLPQWEENNFPALDDLDKIVDGFSEADRIFRFESPLEPPQSSALDIPVTGIFASLPQLGVGDQGLEIMEPHLNSATAITFQQLESLPEQVQLQQRVTRPEEFSGSNIELQQKLLESEERNSELQQKLRKAEVENEKWRSMFHQVAKLMASSNLDAYPVGIQ